MVNKAGSGLAEDVVDAHLHYRLHKDLLDALDLGILLYSHKPIPFGKARFRLIRIRAFLRCFVLTINAQSKAGQLLNDGARWSSGSRLMEFKQNGRVRNIQRLTSGNGRGRLARRAAILACNFRSVTSFFLARRVASVASFESSSSCAWAKVAALYAVK